MGYLMPKPFFLKDNSGIWPLADSRGISLKVNQITWLEFELVTSMPQSSTLTTTPQNTPHSPKIVFWSRVNR